MRMGIIIRSYGEKEPSGMSRLVDLTNLMIQNNPDTEFIVYLKDRPRIPLPFSGHNWKMEILGWGKFWLYLGLFFAPKADVFLFFTPLLPFFWRRKSIVMAHDFGYKYVKPVGLKEWVSLHLLGYLNNYAFKKASLITAVSSYAKDEIIKFFRISEEKIKVVYDGFTKVCAVPEERVDIEKPFFLFAGVIKERKNVLNIVKAFADFKKNDAKNFKLAIAGRKSGAYYQKIVKFIEQENLTNDVVFLGYMVDKNMSYLYKNAKALVFPSLIEGFGMPILEAMDCGLPVITSNRGALSETAGGAALLVDPCGVNDIARAMSKLASDANFSKKLIKNGFERAKQFSWDKTAEELVKLATSL